MRAKNMQALTDAAKAAYPGIIIYGKGDAAHAAEVSGHNEDDTPGVRAELQDADSIPEHRAIDLMIGPAFTKAQADALVAAILADPAARARLYYIIWNGYIWSRSHGWTKRAYTGSDRHTGHIHLSGWVDDDDNTAGWPAVYKGGTTSVWCAYKDTNENVRYLQYRLANLGFDVGKVDSNYGDKTAAALKAACLKQYKDYSGDGKVFGADEAIYLDALWEKAYASFGTADLLDRIKKLEAAIGALKPVAGLALPATVTLTGTLKAS